MRIIFKKFRTRMIVGCILAVIALLAVSVIVFINQPSFGRTPRGERLERVMKSPNYRDGGYDTHYAEIGNRFPDIDLAMSEGYSTASDEVRMMGFGAGMGLCNMARNSDRFDIQSQVGVGTKVTMIFDL